MKFTPIVFFLLGMLIVIFFSFSSQLIASEANSLWEQTGQTLSSKNASVLNIEGNSKPSNLYPRIIMNTSNPNASAGLSLTNSLVGDEKSLSLVSYSRNDPQTSLLQGYNRSVSTRIWSVYSNFLIDTFSYGNLSLGTLGLRAIHIDENQNVEISTLKATYTGGSAYVCVYDNGTLYASEVGC